MPTAGPRAPFCGRMGRGTNARFYMANRSAQVSRCISPVKPRPARLVLEAPFSSVVDIARGRFPLMPVRPLIVDRFDSTAKIGKVAAPILIVHGERDRTIPVRLARKLFKRAREPKEGVFIPEADHADLVDFGLPAIVLEFLAHHGHIPT